MNILFYGWEYPPQGGGVGAYMMHMARSLSDLGHSVVVVTGRTKGIPEKECMAGVCVYRIYERHEIGNNAVARKVLELARQHNIDWIEGADHLGECASILAYPDRPPIVIKVHSCNVLRVLRQSHILYRWQRYLIAISLVRKWREYCNEKICIEQADVLLAPTWRIVDALKRQRISLPSSVEVVPNTLSPAKSKQVSEDPRPTILFVGRIDIGKGIQYLPYIMERVKTKNVRLEIAGADSFARGLGSLRSWIEKKLNEVCVEVQFLGKLDKEELAKAYQRAWVVIVPSRWDNFPTVILEAMQHEKPVVSSPHGGMAEMLCETESRIALPDSQEFPRAIDQFLQDKRLRVDGGKTMKNKLDTEYSSQKIAKQYIDAVTGALSSL